MFVVWIQKFNKIQEYFKNILSNGLLYSVYFNFK